MKNRNLSLLLFACLGLTLSALSLLGFRSVAAKSPEKRFISSQSLDSATDALESFPPGWEYQCANCPFYIALTSNRNLRVDSQGRLHVAFGRYVMYYGVFDGGGWQFDVVDNEAPLGNYSSLAVDADGNPHVAYRTNYSKAVYYAYKDTNGWRRELVDNSNTDVYDNGGFTSIEIDPQGRPHILFRGYVDNDIQPLMHAYRDGSGWHKETVDANGNMGMFNSIAIDADGYLHASYVDQTNYEGDLSRVLYAYQDAGGWHYEVVEDAINDNNANNYGGSSITLTSGGQPIIAYYYHFPDGTTSVRLARRQPDGEWLKEDPYIGSIGGWFPSLVLDGSDYPHILHAGHYEGYWQTVFHTYQAADGWHFDVVDPMNWNADCLSAAQDADGNLYAFYKATDNNNVDDIPGNNLVLATLQITATGWITDIVAPYGSAGDFSGLVMDADDHPHIISQDGGNSEDVRYTFWDGAAWHDELAALDARGNLNSYAISALALDAEGNPRITYVNDYQEWMAYGYRDETGWHFEHIPGIFRTSFALGIGPDGYPRIAYAEGPLGFAYKDGLGWHTEVLSTTSAGELSMQLDTDGHAHLSFNASSKLWYAYQDAGGGWHFEKVNTSDAVGSAYGTTSLALDADGNPYIAHLSYPGTGSYKMIVSYKAGSAWQSIVVENDVSGYPNLAIDSQGFPHVVYMGKKYGDYPEYKWNLRYAHQDETGWHYETLDVTNIVMARPDIVLDSQDRPFVSYADYNFLAVVSKTAPPDEEIPTLPNAPGSDSPLITPINGATVNTSRPLFDWNDGEDNVGVVSYTLVITSDIVQALMPAPATVYQLITTESDYTPAWDLPNGDYTWTVRAYDAAGNASPWVTPQQFVVNFLNRVFLPLVMRAP